MILPDLLHFGRGKRLPTSYPYLGSQRWWRYSARAKDFLGLQQCSQPQRIHAQRSASPSGCNVTAEQCELVMQAGHQGWNVFATALSAQYAINKRLGEPLPMPHSPIGA